MEGKNINENVLLHIRYDLLGRMLLVLFSLFGLYIGLFFVIADNTNILLKVIGVLIFLQSLWLFFDVLFFKEMKITKTKIEKIWLFGKLSVPIKKIDYAYRSFYKINRGKIVFRSSQSIKRNFYLHNCMAIHLVGVSNYKQVLLEIKKVFINLSIIKGDEYEWNN